MHKTVDTKIGSQCRYTYRSKQRRKRFEEDRTVGYRRVVKFGGITPLVMPISAGIQDLIESEVQRGGMLTQYGKLAFLPHCPSLVSTNVMVCPESPKLSVREELSFTLNFAPRALIKVIPAILRN